MSDIKISAITDASVFNASDKATGLQGGLNRNFSGTLIEAFINRTGGSVYTSLFAKAPLASPAFTGVPTAPTAATGTNTTQIATTAFVQDAVAASTAGVASFNGRTGIVTPATGDYTKSQVGLSNVDNTSDASKPVSTAQAAINATLAPLASPALSGNPTAPTQTAGNNSTRIATTAFVQTAVADIVGGLADPDYPALTGSTWDGSPASIELTADTNLTLTTTANNGVLHVKQNGTGGWNLTINGSAPIAINTAANSASAVYFSYVVDNATGELRVGVDTSYTIIASGGDTTPPSLSGAPVVADINPLQVAFTFGETLDPTHVPLNSDFTISGHTTTGLVIVSGVNVYVHVTTPFVEGEAARVAAYTPGLTANKLQDASGNLVAAFSGVTITNSVIMPTLTSATVENATPSQVDLVFSEDMDSVWSAAAAFAVAGHTVSTVTRLTTTTGYLTLATPVVSGEATDVSYTIPGSNKMKDTPGGNLLASFTGFTITNHVSGGGSGSSYGGVTGAVFHINGKPANLTLSGANVTGVTNLAGTGSVSGINTYGAYPTYVAASGTTNPDVIDINSGGSNIAQLIAPSLSFAGTNDLTVMVIAKIVPGTTGIIGEMSAAGDGSEHTGFTILSNGSGNTFFAAANGDVGASIWGGNSSVTDMVFLLFNLHKSLSTNEVTIELNGSAFGSSIADVNNTNGFVSQQLYIGCRPTTGSNPLRMQLAEYVIFPRILTTGEKSALLAQAVTDYGTYTTEF